MASTDSNAGAHPAKKQPGDRGRMNVVNHLRSGAARTDHPEGCFPMRVAEAVPYTSKGTNRPMTAVIFRYPSKQLYWLPVLNLTGGPTLAAADQPDGLNDGPFTTKMMFEDLDLPADADLRDALPGQDFAVQIHKEREGKYKGKAKVIAYTPRKHLPDKVLPKLDAGIAKIPDYDRPKWVEGLLAAADNKPTGIEVPTAPAPAADDGPVDEEMS